MDKVSTEQVRAAVQRYWDAIGKKEKDKLAGFYANDAIVFMADARRTEPARLIIERRGREFFDTQGSAGAQIGTIDVVIPSDDVAIATYGYHFRAVRLRGTSRFQIDMPGARATQVFRREPDGELRIVHEHLSASKNPTLTKLD